MRRNAFEILKDGNNAVNFSNSKLKQEFEINTVAKELLNNAVNFSDTNKQIKSVITQDKKNKFAKNKKTEEDKLDKKNKQTKENFSRKQLAKKVAKGVGLGAGITAGVGALGAGSIYGADKMGLINKSHYNPETMAPTVDRPSSAPELRRPVSYETESNLQGQIQNQLNTNFKPSATQAGPMMTEKPELNFKLKSNEDMVKDSFNPVSGTYNLANNNPYLTKAGAGLMNRVNELSAKENAKTQAIEDKFNEVSNKVIEEIESEKINKDMNQDAINKYVNNESSLDDSNNYYINEQAMEDAMASMNFSSRASQLVNRFKLTPAEKAKLKQAAKTAGYVGAGVAAGAGAMGAVAYHEPIAQGIQAGWNHTTNAIKNAYNTSAEAVGNAYNVSKDAVVGAADATRGYIHEKAHEATNKIPGGIDKAINKVANNYEGKDTDRGSELIEGQLEGVTLHALNRGVPAKDIENIINGKISEYTADGTPLSYEEASSISDAIVNLTVNFSRRMQNYSSLEDQYKRRKIAAITAGAIAGAGALGAGGYGYYKNQDAVNNYVTDKLNMVKDGTIGAYNNLKHSINDMTNGIPGSTDKLIDQATGAYNGNADIHSQLEQAVKGALDKNIPVEVIDKTISENLAKYVNENSAGLNQAEGMGMISAIDSLTPEAFSNVIDSINVQFSRYSLLRELGY